MNDIIDGIGTASAGGLFARALDPDSGAREAHPHQPEHCENCGAVLTGAYCHACGQKGHLHRTIGGFLHDLVHGAFHFEGKFWRTLPMLLFRPGALTRRYIDGERARFVSPMAMFLFTVFLMFAVFQMVGITAPSDIPAGEEIEQSAVATAAAELAEKEAQLVGSSLSEQERRDLQNEMTFLRDFLDRVGAADQLELESGLAQSQNRAAPDADTADDARGTDEQTFNADLNSDGNSSIRTETTGVAFIDSAVSKWRNNPSLMLYKMQANAYKFSWLLIPISIPFVWLLFFWKRRFKAYDHAIFITYSLSFMTLLFVIASALGVAGLHPATIVAAMIFIPPIHLYKHLRGAYAIGRVGAFARLLVLSAFIWIVIALFIQLLFLLGAF